MYEQKHRKVSEMIKDRMHEPKIDMYATSVWVDFSRLNEISNQVHDNHNYSEEDNHKQEGDLNQQSLMYLKSSMDKDERIFKLENAISNNKIKTVQEASDLLEVEVATVIKYLREIDETLLDENKNERVGSTEEYKLSESKQLGHYGKKNKYRPTFRYFDGNPEQGANEITYEEHVYRIKEFKKQKLQLLESLNS